MNDNPLDDHALMARLKGGDESAFNLLFERHWKRVLNIVYRYLGRESEAEDIAQRVFMKVYEKAGVYEPRAKFTTYLYQIVGNLCLNIRRDRGRRKTYAASEYSLDGDGFNPLLLQEDDSVSSEEGMMLDERAEMVRLALQELPDNQRIALVLTHYEGATQQELADAMKISTNAAKQLCHRARATLRKVLLPSMEEGDEMEEHKNE